jgi:hypothetical protein
MNSTLVSFDEEIPNQFLPTFATLPNLAHFSMSNLWAISSMNNLFMSRFLRSVTSQCVNIKSFSFDNRSFCQMVSDEFTNELQAIVPWYDGIIFPSVDTLNLTGPFFPRLERGETDQIPLMTREMFPGLKNISIDFGPRLYDSALDMFEQCFLPGLLSVEGILSLELKTSYRNWLGNFTSENYVLGRGNWSAQ